MLRQPTIRKLVTDAMVELFDRIKNDEEFVNAYNTKIDLEVAQGKKVRLKDKIKRTICGAQICFYRFRYGR